MPAAVVRELALDEQVPVVTATQPAFTRRHAWSVGAAGANPIQGRLARLAAGIGMPAANIASDTMFGGLALFFGNQIFFVWGLDASGGWKIAWPIPLGMLHGVFAIGLGLVMLARLAWTWNSPLRYLRR